MNFANKVSIFRILSVPFFVSAVLYYSPERDFFRFIALGIFLLAVGSDAVDGFIARIGKQKTKIGAILDPLADKLLLISAFICLYSIRNLLADIRLPLWVVLVIISRDILILLGAGLILMLGHELKVKPSLWGKFTTSFQMLAVIFLLLQLKIAELFWLVAVFFTIVSCADYLRQGANILYSENAKNNIRGNA